MKGHPALERESIMKRSTALVCSNPDTFFSHASWSLAFPAPDRYNRSIYSRDPSTGIPSFPDDGDGDGVLDDDDEDMDSEVAEGGVAMAAGISQGVICFHGDDCNL